MEARFEAWDFTGTQTGSGKPSPELREMLSRFDEVKVMLLDMGCGVNYYSPYPSTIMPIGLLRCRFLAEAVVKQMNYQDGLWAVVCNHFASGQSYQYTATENKIASLE